ncbi:MAG: DUF4907 domain-containing protein [Crocinitomicaceae bacterium]|nr:DUF4907 domain-containing protein [Crocinitomicaceae bacterium]
MRKKSTRFAFTAIVSSIILAGCGARKENESTETSSDSSSIETNVVEKEFDSTEFIDISSPIEHDYNGQYTYSTFQNEDDSWGYLILDDSSTFIRQTNIPAIPGKKGFSSDMKAQTTASFVIYKLEQGFFPPSLTKNELDSLGVLD